MTENTHAVRLLDNLFVVSGEKLTHIWDANAYLIGGDEPTLIDCGGLEGYPMLKRNLAELGYQPKDIRRVIATHGHWDHLSAMSLLRRESDATLLLHPAEKLVVETGDWERTSAFLYNCAFPPTPVDGLIYDGDILRVGKFEMRVLHTPGHTPGGVCFWMNAGGLKILIAGDTLFGGYHPKIHSNLDDWIQSVDRLLELDFDVMTIGHCPPGLIFDAKRRVREARDRLGVYFDPWFKPFYHYFRY